ncbi:MAG: methyltransferase, partial [Woeseiaceae bacterium]|nr:methyltransferase [Woeseiaceae bacterium]
EFMANMANWIETFKADAAGWSGDNGPSIEAFWFGQMPESLAGTADVVFFPRVLHNLANFQNAGNGPYLDEALADAYAILKPGGVFGVVQHEARESMSDEFANGTHGYLKKAWVIEQVEKAGFEFVDESNINQNPLDQPSETDIVWRLPPTYNGVEEGSEMREKLAAIGESNRMTLKFQKPE